MQKLIRKANVVTYWICDHLVGEDHTHKHRCVVGLVFMVAGVAIAQSAAEIHFPLAHSIGDGLGYLLHGIGTFPYVEALVPIMTTLKNRLSDE